MSRRDLSSRTGLAGVALVAVAALDLLVSGVSAGPLHAAAAFSGFALLAASAAAGAGKEA